MGYPRLHDDPSITKTIGLWYDQEKNWFVDEDGYVVFHLWWYITPMQHMIFLNKQTNCSFRCATQPHILVELFWTEEWGEEMLRDAREKQQNRMCPWFSDQQKQFQWELECSGKNSFGTEFLIAGDVYELDRSPKKLCV